MGRDFEALGISVGVLQEGMNQLERRENLLKDVTYVTAQSLCFTYLFDQTSQSPDLIVSLQFQICLFTKEIEKTLKKVT